MCPPGRVVHRDVSAANVLLTAQGVRLLDFGLARQDLQLTLTAPDQAMGTPAYAAPEQIDSHTVDARTDLFAVGVLLYQMLTGRLPWQERDAVKLFLAKSNTPPPPPNQLNPMISRSLSELIMDLLRAHPEERPESADAVLRRLS
ncbi:serine/threonine protein kinase [bacterium CPR1]|nr:serine/threonine protein kinase [bacterium CPR1]